jgi:hypothetical protein
VQGISTSVGQFAAGWLRAVCLRGSMRSPGSLTGYGRSQNRPPVPEAERRMVMGTVSESCLWEDVFHKPLKCYAITLDVPGTGSIPSARPRESERLLLLL